MGEHGVSSTAMSAMASPSDTVRREKWISNCSTCLKEVYSGIKALVVLPKDDLPRRLLVALVLSVPPLTCG